LNGWVLKARETGVCAMWRQNEEISIRARDMTLWPEAMRQRYAYRGFFSCRLLRLDPKSSIAAAARARHLPDAIPAVIHRNIDPAENVLAGFTDHLHPRNPSVVRKASFRGRPDVQTWHSRNTQKSSAPLIKAADVPWQGKSDRGGRYIHGPRDRLRDAGLNESRQRGHRVKFQLTTCP
jgi:hypothetical protein